MELFWLKTLTIQNEDWRPPEVDFGPFCDLFAAKNGRFLGWRFFGHIQQSTQVKIQLKIRSKRFTNYNYSSIVSVSLSIRFVSSLFIVIVVIERTIVIKTKERGALPFVIKPFLYCDLFKASAQAKINIFVSFSLDGFDHKSLQIVRTQIHSLKLSN